MASFGLVCQAAEVGDETAEPRLGLLQRGDSFIASLAIHGRRAWPQHHERPAVISGPSPVK